MVPDSSNIHEKAPPDKGASCFVYPPTDSNLDFFAEALARGCLVAIPTETVYGLAGLALDEEACRRIFTVKGRPLLDPLIVHLANPGMLPLIAEVPEAMDQLAAAFWPGPLTVILNKKPIVPDLVTAGKPTVAVRVPRHPVAHDLLVRLAQPLAAPSANPFGYISPTCPQHVAESFAGRVSYIIDGGLCEIGLESTILDLSKPDSPSILRPGAISASCISTVLGVPVLDKVATVGMHEAATAPGTFCKHYSPKTILSLFETGSAPRVTSEEAILYLKRQDSTKRDNVFWMTEDGSLISAAHSLYSLLRKIDSMGFTHIYCEMPARGEDGYSNALRDRLSRAAAK